MYETRLNSLALDSFLLTNFYIDTIWKDHLSENFKESQGQANETSNPLKETSQCN